MLPSPDGGRALVRDLTTDRYALVPLTRVATLLDEDGRVSRRYPLSGADRVAFSPDGRQALLTGSTLDGHVVRERNSLLDLRTGVVRAVPAGGDQWYDGERLLRVEPRESAGTVVTVLVAATGQIERRSTLPGRESIVGVSLARGGPAPPGAIVI